MADKNKSRPVDDKLKDSRYDVLRDLIQPDEIPTPKGDERFNELRQYDNIKALLNEGAMPEQVAPKPARSAGNYASNYVEQAIHGVPIVGPLTEKASDALGALVGIGQGDSIGSRYTSNQERRAARIKEFSDENPLTSGMARVAGGMAAMVPLGATQLGATALGLGGRTLAERSALGAISGGAIGGTDAAVRGENVPAGAAMGTVLGGTIPYVGRAIGMMGNKVAELASPVASRASDILSNALGPNGVSNVIAGVSRNPRLAPMDVDINLRNIAEGIATIPGRGKEIIASNVGTRQANAGDAVRTAFDNAAGPTPNVLALLEKLQKTKEANAAQGFGDALANASPIDLSKFSKSDLVKINQAWERVSAKFPDKSQVRFTQPEIFHMIQSELGRESKILSRSQGQDKLAAGDVEAVRQRLIDQIDAASGGKFRPAQAKYREDSDVQEAFDTGFKLLKQTAGNVEARPEYIAKLFKDSTPEEIEAIRLGIRTHIDNQMLHARNAARTGEAIVQPEYDQSVLRTAFGKQEADRLISALRDETMLAQNNQRLLGNSMTESRKENVKMVQPQSVDPIYAMGPAMMAGGISSAAQYLTGHPLAYGAGAVALGARHVLQRVGNAVDNAANARVAEAISSAGSQGQMLVNDILAARYRNAILGQKSEDKANVLLRGVGQSTLPEVQPFIPEPLRITVRPRIQSPNE